MHWRANADWRRQQWGLWLSRWWWWLGSRSGPIDVWTASGGECSASQSTWSWEEEERNGWSWDWWDVWVVVVCPCEWCSDTTTTKELSSSCWSRFQLHYVHRGEVYTRGDSDSWWSSSSRRSRRPRSSCLATNVGSLCWVCSGGEIYERQFGEWAYS